MDWLTESVVVQPRVSVTFKVTRYLPELAKEWDGELWVLTMPSLKSQTMLWTPKLLLICSLKRTISPGQTESGVPLKEMTGPVETLMYWEKVVSRVLLSE